MPLYTKQHDIYAAGAAPKTESLSITIGTVVDTNDPQQMGRVRVVCPQWGDSWTSDIADLPWAIYMSPLAGQVQVGSRGPGVQTSEGGVAYGLWAIPKVGAQVAVVCVDGNPMTRMYIGSIFDQFTPHTMPHGRFMYDDHPSFDKTKSSPAPYGPFTSSEKPIEPLSSNLKQAFGHRGEPNYEFRTRAADYTATRVDVDQLPTTFSHAQDDKDVKHDGWTNTQGYQVSRVDPNGHASASDKNYDNMVTALVSPGFHALSMDDRQENCRIRLRTTAGHQIIMDDTNERIYISTAAGNNWIELDQNGNIDVFTSNTLNVHAAREINMTSDETIRLYGKKGVHIKSDQDVRIQAGDDVHIKAAGSIRGHAGATLNLESNGATNFKIGGALTATAGGTVMIDGSTIHLNGGGSATSAGELEALWTNRVPQHEPWARSMTKADNTHTPEHPYDGKNVNRVERGRTVERGMFWRR